MKIFATLLLAASLGVTSLSAADFISDRNTALKTMLESGKNAETVNTAISAIASKYTEFKTFSQDENGATLRTIIDAVYTILSSKNPHDTAIGEAAYFEKFKNFIATVDDIEQLDRSHEKYEKNKQELVEEANQLSTLLYKDISILLSQDVKNAEDNDGEDAIATLYQHEAKLVINTWVLLAKIALELPTTSEEGKKTRKPFSIPTLTARQKAFAVSFGAAALVAAATAYGMQSIKEATCDPDMDHTSLAAWQECGHAVVDSFFDLVCGNK